MDTDSVSWWNQHRLYEQQGASWPTMEAKWFAEDTIIMKLASVTGYDVHKSATVVQKIFMTK